MEAAVCGSRWGGATRLSSIKVGKLLEDRAIRTPVTYAERELVGQHIEALQGLFIGRRQCLLDDFGSAGMLDNFSGR